MILNIIILPNANKVNCAILLVKAKKLNRIVWANSSGILSTPLADSTVVPSAKGNCRQFHFAPGISVLQHRIS